MDIGDGVYLPEGMIGVFVGMTVDFIVGTYLTGAMGASVGVWVDFGEGGYLPEGMVGDLFVSNRHFSGGLLGVKKHKEM